jgi:GT2 family glycosyltransferase
MLRGQVRVTNNTPPLFSIVIPFFNNRAELARCFPTVVEVRERNSAVREIIAVDDCSTDGTADWIRQNYPDVTVLINSRNLGFGRTCLEGIRQARHDWIILLNSDIEIISDIVTPLVEDIQKCQGLFSVGFFSFDEKGGKFEGRKKFVAKTGLFKTRNNYSGEYVEGALYDTFYACGGHSLISREKFCALNGFSPVFEPFYWEDTDLSYRAMKRGWPVFFDPRCRVIHAQRGSIRTANGERFILTIQTRNKMLFFWKNVSSPALWLYHAVGMFFRVLTSWIAGDFVFYSALWKALAKLPQIMALRSLEKKMWVKKDRELFKIGRDCNMRK